MRVVNVTGQTQIVAEAALTIEPGQEADWPDELPLPATLAPADSAESPAPASPEVQPAAAAADAPQEA